MNGYPLDLTRWAIVHVRPLTTSGRDEIEARTVTRKECELLLKEQFGGLAKARRNDRVIKRIE